MSVMIILPLISDTFSLNLLFLDIIHLNYYTLLLLSLKKKNPPTSKTSVILALFLESFAWFVQHKKQAYAERTNNIND